MSVVHEHDGLTKKCRVLVKSLTQGVSEKSGTFVLSIFTMILPIVSWAKHIKIASSVEIC